MFCNHSVCVPQLQRSLCTASKTRCSQIHKYLPKYIVMWKSPDPIHSETTIFMYQLYLIIHISLYINIWKICITNIKWWDDVRNTENRPFPWTMLIVMIGEYTGHYRSPELEVGSWVCACSVAQLCPTLCDPVDCSLPGSSVLSGKNTGMGCHFLLQGIFLIQGLNPGLFHFLHWQVDSLPLCHLGSRKGFLGGGPEKILYPFLSLFSTGLVLPT